MEILETAKYIGGIIAVILVGLIKIPKLELNIWNWLGRLVGRSLTKELDQKLDIMDQNQKSIKDELAQLDSKLDKHIVQDEISNVKQIRQRIIRFNDEILDDKKHTEESYNCVLEDIDIYEKYCDDNPKFPNNKAVMAIQNIKANYQNCLKNKQFK